MGEIAVGKHALFKAEFSKSEFCMLRGVRAYITDEKGQIYYENSVSAQKLIMFLNMRFSAIVNSYAEAASIQSKIKIIGSVGASLGTLNGGFVKIPLFLWISNKPLFFKIKALDTNKGCKKAVR